eukprot:820516-Rhodomonas_salina.1
MDLLMWSGSSLKQDLGSGYIGVFLVLVASRSHAARHRDELYGAEHKVQEKVPVETEPVTDTQKNNAISIQREAGGREGSKRTGEGEQEEL